MGHIYLGVIKDRKTKVLKRRKIKVYREFDLLQDLD